jgi:glycosyltransferase involved in cell wall biosynthesis
MKILLITNGYPPGRWAGTETYTAGLAEELTARGHFVQVLCIGDWEDGDAYWNGVSEDVQNGIQVKRINLNWTRSPDPFGYLYDNPVVGMYLENLLQAESFDLVHVTSCETLSASVLRVAKASGLALVLSITDFWFLCPRINLLHANGSNCSGQTPPTDCLDCLLQDSKWYKFSQKMLPENMLLPLLNQISQYPIMTRQRGLRGMAGNMAERKAMLKSALTLPDLRITASGFVRDIFVSNGVTVPIEVNPYGHNLDWLKKYTGKSESPQIRFGYIGQISEAKGVHLILQALSHLPQSYLEKLSVVIYGNLAHAPPYGQRIKDLAAPLPNVRFGGTYSHADSAGVFSEIDVLLVPSIWYDFPLIIYEAFATQTPVVATNLGGMAESVSDKLNGLLFERGSTTDLACQMQKLIDEPELLKHLRLGIPKVKTNIAEVDELEKKYFELIRFSTKIKNRRNN